jgi:hypothetical protein
VASQCVSDPDCDDGDPCTADACSGSLCTNGPVPPGTTCDDGDPGTVQDACFGGICSGVAIQCGSDLAVDPKGKGTGVANHPLFEAPIAFMVKGRQKGRNENVKIALKFKLNGGDSQLRVKGSASQTFDIDTLQGIYNRSSKLKLTAGDEKLKDSETSGGIPLSEFPGELPSGDWILFLDVVNLDGSRLEASATLLMGSGSEIAFVGKGKLSSKTGASKLSLKSLEKGAKLKPVGLLVDSNGLAGGEFKYKVLGQGGVATEWTATASATCEE